MDRQSKITLGSLAIIVLTILGWNIYTYMPPEVWVTSQEQLPNNQVCMVNDAYMGIDQIEVPVDDQIYFGCCEMCVTKLKNIPKTRYATDPVTGQEVDKSSAFITLNPDSKQNGVLYFASEENAKEFFTR